jgi:hypothetical protein
MGEAVMTAPNTSRILLESRILWKKKTLSKALLRVRDKMMEGL